MRIVQINGGAKGSTGKIMMGIAEVARAQGHEVMFRFDNSRSPHPHHGSVW